MQVNIQCNILLDYVFITGETIKYYSYIEGHILAWI